MNETSTASVLIPAAAALAGTIIGVISTIFVSSRSERAQEALALHDMLNKMISFGIEYPYLENTEYCSRWSDNPDDENSMRYDNYCCFVFNLLERSWKHHKGDEQKLFDFIHVPEIVKLHSVWWQSDPENRLAYEHGFQELVDEHIVISQLPRGED